MSWFLTGAVVLTAGSTALQMKSQRDLADNQIKQGEMDRIASDSSTKNAEEEAQRQESFDLSEVARELIASKATTIATQANSGVSGVTQDRIKRDLDMQNSLDVNFVKRQGEQTLFSIRNAGFNNDASIQNSINSAKSSKPTKTAMAVSSVLAGGQTYLTVQGVRGGKK